MSKEISSYRLNGLYDTYFIGAILRDFLLQLEKLSLF